MESYRLSPSASRALASTRAAPGSADPKDARTCGEETSGILPADLSAYLRRFVADEPAAACLVRALPIDDGKVGLTPQHWREVTSERPTLGIERVLASCAAVLGKPFTWRTLQAGRMIQDILPIRGEEVAQSGHGSGALLEFHTEDGFHPDRCDYLLLLGMRNHDRIPTFLACIEEVRLEPAHRDVLFEPRFHILPDPEHIRQLSRDNPGHPELRKALRMRDFPPAVSVLFGERADPYLRIDYPFMRPVGHDRLAQVALDALMVELYRVKQDVVIGQGDLLVVDNYRAVHGRASFHARYDGRDRWLKRMIVRRTRPRRRGGRDLSRREG